MNALTRIDRMDNLFPEMIRRIARPLWLAPEAPEEIRIDVVENDKNFQVRAEIPGAKKDDIHVTVDGNFVSISAEVKQENEERSGGRMLLKETYYGSISRGFSLTQDVDPKGVVAKLDNGILNVTLPKREGSSTRSIPIQ
ncbi:MAG: Hsp20/alpha crystallin family protein [Aquabacterium sp.]|nr:Hsp20/alpha crystallin family protein [Aquabacterium sp.]